MLERSVEGPAGSRVLIPIDELHMLCHALYHGKSYSTGIPSAHNGNGKSPEMTILELSQKSGKLCLNVGGLWRTDHYMRGDGNLSVYSSKKTRNAGSRSLW